MRKKTLAIVSPSWLALSIMVAVSVAFMLGATGCADSNIVRPSIDSPADAIVVTAVDIKAAADSVYRACGAMVDGGPCADGAAITTEQKDEAKAQLLRAQRALEAADALLAAGESAASQQRLDLVAAILLEINRQLMESDNE